MAFFVAAIVRDVGDIPLVRIILMFPLLGPLTLVGVGSGGIGGVSAHSETSLLLFLPSLTRSLLPSFLIGF